MQEQSIMLLPGGNNRENIFLDPRNKLIYGAINQEVLSRRELAKRLQIDPARITRGFQKVEEAIKNKLKN